MCSLIGFKTNLGYAVFSIRDEAADRPTQLPSTITHNTTTYLLPQDLKAGGTWWCVDLNKKELAVLLNAKLETPKNSFSTSRGMVIPALFMENKPWESLPLDEINGFQVFSWKKEMWSQLSWNGTKQTETHVTDKPLLFAASSTLYGPTDVAERENWLQETLKKIDLAALTWEDLLRFSSELIVQLSCKVPGKKSVSITTFLFAESSISVNYFDNIGKSNYFYVFN